MKKLTDDIIKEALDVVRDYLVEHGTKSTFIFEERPSAWRELARLVVEEGYTAQKVYEVINAAVENVAPWSFVSFEISEEDYRLFIVTKNAYRLFVDFLNRAVKEED